MLVTALALSAIVLAGCGHETELKEAPDQVAKEQSAADAHNADTVPFAGDDETPSTELPSTSTTAVPEYEGAEALRVGDCIDLPTYDTASVRAVTCDHPHNGEVTAKIDVGPRFPNGAPTRDDFQRIRETDCHRAFDAYVRQPAPPGIVPNSFEVRPEAWYLGDHVVTCIAESQREGNVLTGSVRKPA